MTTRLALGAVYLSVTQDAVGDDFTVVICALVILYLVAIAALVLCAILFFD